MTKKTHKKRISWFLRHPWLPSILTIAYVLFGLTIPLLVIYVPNIGEEVPRFFIFVAFVLISGPITLTILQIMNFKHSLASIRGLAMLYLEIILMFGVIYFYAVSSESEVEWNHLNSSNAQGAFINGINSEWIYQLKAEINAENNNNEYEIVKSMLICFQDCVHFSLITSTTVGYGDMTPASPMSKFLVDLQVLVSFFLISFGVAYFFSTHRPQSVNRDVAAIQARLDALEKNEHESEINNETPTDDHIGTNKKI